MVVAVRFNGLFHECRNIDRFICVEIAVSFVLSGSPYSRHATCREGGSGLNILRVPLVGDAGGVAAVVLVVEVPHGPS